jgi:hypothetical protein
VRVAVADTGPIHCLVLIGHIKRTNFRYRQEIMDELLAQQKNE